MIELFHKGSSIKLKSPHTLRVGSVAQLNSEDYSFDLDYQSFARLIAPKSILNSGSAATKRDRATAKENGLYFGDDIDFTAIVELIKANYIGELSLNENLLNTERSFSKILKCRMPIEFDTAKLQSYINLLEQKHTDLHNKWRFKFAADILQKSEAVRVEISEKYGVDKDSISKASIASSTELSISEKKELFSIMDIWNLRQEISTLRRYLEDPRLSFNFIPYGSVSGRVTTFDSNIQGRTKEHFKNVKMQKNGYVLKSIDFSQIELRIACELWGDITMKSVFESGGDIHLNTAKAQNSGDRDLAKALNYGLIYGMGAETFMVYAAQNYGVILSKADAEKAVGVFKTTYPGLFSERSIFEGMSYYTEPLGREVHAQDIFDGNYELKRRTNARNVVVQGTAADILKIATNSLSQMLGKDGAIAFTNHDEIGFWTKKRGADRFVEDACKEITSFLFDKTRFKLPVSESDRFL